MIPGLRDSIVIHASPLFVHAFRFYQSEHPVMKVRDFYYSWSDFIPSRDACPQWVILDAFLDDYVPLILKVRALSSLGATPIILGSLDTRQEEVLLEAGAAGFISGNLTIPELVGEIGLLVSTWTRVTPNTTGERCMLTDRELQILELFSRRRGLHTGVLGPALGLSPGTVRVHLRNARVKLKLMGQPCTSRAQLGQAVVALGYSVSDAQWRLAGRW